jgi:hypothetical protein
MGGSVGADDPLLLRSAELGRAFLVEEEQVDVTRLPSTGSDPPRSFSLAQTCERQSGGGVFSASSGALVGILTSSLGRSCAEPDIGVVVELAPFRRWLLDAGGPELLLVEPEPGAAGVASCDER